MAGALGLLTGGLLGVAKGYGQEKMAERQRQEQHKSALADMMVQQGLQTGDKSFFSTPEVKKMIEAQYGPNSADMLGGLAETLNKPLTGFPTMGGGGGSPSASSQMIGAAGGGGQVQKAALTSASPTAGTPSTGPAGVAPQERHLGGADVNDPQAIRDHLDKVYEYGRQFPGNARVQDAVKQEVEHWDNRLKDIEKEQEFDITKSQQLIEFGITKQMQDQFHQDSQQMHEQTLASLNQNRQFMQQMQSESQDIKKQSLFDQQVKNLQSSTESISKMLFTANPTDAETAKTLLAQRNAQVRQLKAQADKAGISYDPEEFTPLTIKQVPGWWKSHFGVGGTMSTVTEDTGAATTPSIPEGARAGRDASGKVVGYSLNGKWTAL